jgi:subtilisin family serine protease
VPRIFLAIGPLRRAAGSASCFELQLPEPNILGTRIANSLRGKRINALTQALESNLTSFRVLVTAHSASGARLQRALNFNPHASSVTSPARDIVAAQIDRATLLQLAGNRDVDVLSSDAQVQSSGVTWTSTTPVVTNNRLVRTLGMDYWVPNGKDVVVAVIDSGVVANSNLQSAAKYDFTTGKPKAVAGGDLYFDGYGHGSHVASLIANMGASSDKPYRGVAPSASVVALKVLDDAGAGYTSNVIAAIDFCIANKYKLKIDIINLSLGHPIYEPAATDSLVQAVERAVRAGMAVIVSAGNFGLNPATGQEVSHHLVTRRQLSASVRWTHAAARR